MSSVLLNRLRWLGHACALAGVLFVIYRLCGYCHQLDFSILDRSTKWYILVLCFLYCLSNGLLALGWYNLIRHYGASLTYVKTLQLYGISQLGKYVPGNIFHLAGRQALGMSLGVPASTLLRATVFELGCLVLAGVVFGWLCLPLLDSHVSTFTGVLLFVLTALIMAILFRRLATAAAMQAFICYFIFLVCSGVIFSAVVFQVNGAHECELSYWLMISGGFIIAWLAGFAVPGAPAGVGVRELILVFLLKDLLLEKDLLIAIMLGRAVTVAGDLLFFGATFILANTTKQLRKVYA